MYCVVLVVRSLAMVDCEDCLGSCVLYVVVVW